MRLEWLEDILVVAETGSFSEAAERRRLTQSAFSRRIQNIEHYVGVELFDRSRKPIQLRDTTHEHRDRIVQMVGMLKQLLVDLRRTDRMARNTLVISSQHALTASLTSSFVEKAHTYEKDIYLRLRSANLGECIGHLLSREADIAIIYKLPNEDLPISGIYIESEIIAQDRLIPVIAPAARPRLDDSLSKGEIPIVAYPSEVFLGEVMARKVLPMVNALPVPKAETALTLASIEMASSGLAVAWVPESLARERMTAGKLCDISDQLPSCPMDIVAVRLAGATSSVENAFWLRLLGSTTASKIGDESVGPYFTDKGDYYES
ncbi:MULTISPECIES: LysR family transcriptional regulator [unclassified Mesorhizobium]|uniref:LysR family transcriptional regulator n=1 Tax=unclassified Mesorhizobium TaxID=325217 RepID=UPI001092009F|nr:MULTISPECIES: LysR family transcriptional regulator [unclassified Mesorhizobium]TGQ40542.1 LysR family transcriptional regulator [Mesorhizobium sp. M4B.F.Ca.ET.214.01.1.1]TGQ60599.1 LysR family transcriptional regulator [Mesorhizobium sp. M4B.F.Ca.ET.211.01.1.1]TGU36467.1 LysR family transcriptional regulator [Mesorhizobium sp. M4B.F.Ca.ET.150.01.1.1]TIX17031.1 MAG: LysR family transcriptional regulator [Mesorhizobium sp.]